MIQQKNESTSWYSILNVLALDAPIVAIVWQHFFAKNFKIQISILETATLFSTVWFIYLLDHFLDSKKDIPLTKRHLFTSKMKNTTITLLVLTFTTSIYLTTSLPELVILGGICIAIFMCIYLVLVHFSITSFKIKTNSKEFLVGIGFGTGVGLPVIVSDLTITTWLPAIILFCLLCWINCKLIDNWESNRLHFSNYDLFLFLIMFLLMSQTKKPIVIAVIISLISLIILDRIVGSKNTELSRVLADVCLLSPCIDLG